MFYKPVWTEEEEGIIRMTIPSVQKKTGPEWEAFFDERKYEVEKEARLALNSSEFKTTEKHDQVEIAIIRGNVFDYDSERTTRYVREYAKNTVLCDGKVLVRPATDLVCSLFALLTQEYVLNLGIGYIVSMHKPVYVGVDDPRFLLIVGCDYNKKYVLRLDCAQLSRQWSRSYGFAYIVKKP